MFAYYYRDPIAWHPATAREASICLFANRDGDPLALVPGPHGEAVDFDGEYFCFSQTRTQRIRLPFAWEPVAVINCDRYQRPDPSDKVVVGRRLSVASGTAKRPSAAARK